MGSERGRIRAWMKEAALSEELRRLERLDYRGDRYTRPEFLKILRFMPLGSRRHGPIDKTCESYAYVLDIKGHRVQLIGCRYMKLLEALAKSNTQIKPLEKVFVGKGKRGVIRRVLGRIDYYKLTFEATARLIHAIHKIIEENEAIFAELISWAGPITIRLHMFQLLPGLKRDERERLIEEQKRGPFKSFMDIEKRCGIERHRLIKSLAQRFYTELEHEKELNQYQYNKIIMAHVLACRINFLRKTRV